MNLDQFKNAIIILAISAFVAAIMAVALNDFKADQGTNTNVNEENVTRSGVILSPAFTAFPYELVSVSQIDNRSGSILPAEWYNVTTGPGGYITLRPNASNDGNATYNVTYTYKSANSAYNISRAGEVGIQNTSDFFDTIGTVMGVAVLMALVVTAFALANR